ncbi:hypothetical protein [Enterococcus sp. DIV1420a]|uniref:hypothetical protein n=1 Tax=Enterococcus sp. DIV1420a TaxID=2774672 RepID=UPI003F1F3642
MSELRHQEIIDRVHYMYLQTDGTIEFPNSFEGDLLKIAYGTAVQSIKQLQLNENQQIVLEWLKANVEQDNASPMCAIFLLGEWQTRIGSKELRSVDISYCCLNSKQQAEVLNAFSQWSLEQEEAE